MPTTKAEDDLLKYIEPGDEDPLAYALRVLNDNTASNLRRDKMAILLMPFFYTARRYKGARNSAQAAAENMDDDTFMPRSPPKQRPDFYTSRRRTPQ